jgi:hypothetical protein
MRSGPRSPVQITRQQAAAALTSLVKNNAKAQIAVASKGGIEPLIKIISAPAPSRAPSPPALPPSAHEEAEAQLPNMGTPPKQLTPTVDLTVKLVTEEDTMDSKQYAAAAAHSDLCLACECSPRRDILPSHRYAAAALSDLALVAANRDEVVEKNGIMPLVSLLTVADNEGKLLADKAKKFAAAALARLADGHQQTAADIAQVPN